MERQKTNHIFYSNLPLLVKKRSYLKETDIVKNITYDDIRRCLDNNEAENLLLDPYAQDELKNHLQEKFGKIKEMFHINYKVNEIINSFNTKGRRVGTDEILEFEQALIRTK